MRHLARHVRQIVNPFRGYFGPVQFRRIARHPRFTVGSAKLLGHEFYFPDSGSFLHSVQEIFVDQVYRYAPEGERPYIIDAGANMGLSVLYFKRLAPNAVIEAFEPDEAICSLLKDNIRSAELTDVIVHNKAVWTEETELTFYSEGALSGSSELEARPNSASSKVQTVRLKDFISRQKVDFLKIDIEGAENTVLFDVADALDNVRNIFVEYHSISNHPQQLGELLALLSKSGFRYIINYALGPDHPYVDRRTSGYDTQLNISCIRPAF